MLTDFKRILAACTLGGILLLPASSLALPPGGDSAAKEQAEEKAEGRELHPAIRQAMRHLQAAKNVLEHKAASDFGGHKVEAIKSIDEAMEHLRQALQADKK
jgi:hypothetical protein